MGTNPRVLTDIGLTDFIQYILDADSVPCTLIVCASKETFIERLLVACTDTPTSPVNEQENPNPGGETPGPDVDGNKAPKHHELLTSPSLLKLASSQSVKLAFCPDLTHLRAYLASLTVPKPRPVNVDETTNIKPGSKNRPLLAILNPIDIHRSTSSFSAQGFNRTFALAVEAAQATKCRLLMAECTSLRSPETEQFDTDIDYEHELAPPPPVSDNPWDEEVSILNVTTKSFGAGGRGWVGRTVSLRRIAQRWFAFCPFQRLEEDVH